MRLFSELNILYCLFGLWLLLLGFSSSHPLCTDSTAPLTLKKPLTFCPYNGSSCCDSSKDMQLKQQFQSLKISDPACAAIVKSILCATCDPFSAQLFKTGSGQPGRQVPVLCNSTIATCSTQSAIAANDYCGKVWDTCFNVPKEGIKSYDGYINHPLIKSSLQGLFGALPTKQNNLRSSKTEFCKVYGGTSGYDSVCFPGEPVSLKKPSSNVNPPSGVCLEKVSSSTYLNMVGHPDGSNRVFLTDQEGKIWLATVPAIGSGKTLKPSLFLDLSDKVYSNYMLGLMGIAFHPNFVQNGRFFVSFNCAKSKWKGCSGKCACNSDAKCDPSTFNSTFGFPPCTYYSVVSEFNAKIPATMGTEVRRIFSIGLPFQNDHGGQILFGPTDGYLYFMMGDGGGEGDPYNFAQNKRSLLGKIMRFNVDKIPGAKQIEELGLYGSYSIPKDNPVHEDYELLPEIWALGLRNPWRCAFDQKRPSYFLCADDGEDRYDEVDLITKGGNYGWRVYEGPFTYTPRLSPGGNTPANSINPIFPIMGYTHASVNQNLKSGGAAIIGGYYYRSMTDPCLYGRYVYADFFGEVMWAGTENPENSGNFTSNRVTFNCAKDSPIKCSFTSGSSLPNLGFIDSSGEDNSKDVYLATTTGIYRIVQPSRCNYACSKVNYNAGAASSSCL